jgi:hypothetical protein
MEQYDHEVARQEAILYNRPDYAEDLYRPDGIPRERLRIGRAWAVIRGNKVWFMAVMAQRAGKMLTYEPVSIVSAEPAVSHPLDTSRGELAYRVTPEELTETTPSNLTSLSGAGVIRTPTTIFPKGLSTQSIKVQPKSDYLLNVPVRKIDGRVVIKIVHADTDGTLASATVPDSLPSGTASEGNIATLQLPFVNATSDQLRIIVANANSESRPSAIEVGAIELYRLGPTSYLWTKYPRVLVKGLQKVFTTGWMLPLTLLGAGLLVLARRFDALAIACAVPVYFLCTHAPLHLELRYILPVHYFWAMLVATSLYFVFLTVWKLVHGVKPQRTT